MNKYKISIKETLERIIEINADSETEAIDIVKEKYRNEEIVLDYNDYIDADIDVVKEI